MDSVCRRLAKATEQTQRAPPAPTVAVWRLFCHGTAGTHTLRMLPSLPSLSVLKKRGKNLPLLAGGVAVSPALLGSDRRPGSTPGLSGARSSEPGHRTGTHALTCARHGRREPPSPCTAAGHWCASEDTQGVKDREKEKRIEHGGRLSFWGVLTAVENTAPRGWQWFWRSRRTAAAGGVGRRTGPACGTWARGLPRAGLPSVPTPRSCRLWAPRRGGPLHPHT